MKYLQHSQTCDHTARNWFAGMWNTLHGSDLFVCLHRKHWRGNMEKIPSSSTISKTKEESCCPSDMTSLYPLNRHSQLYCSHSCISTKMLERIKKKSGGTLDWAFNRDSEYAVKWMGLLINQVQLVKRLHCHESSNTLLHCGVVILDPPSFRYHLPATWPWTR